ncbi:MAG: sulfatase-like hydrolase/transferase [Bacteroidales bacterium]|nr:sulfatase-like hydrolase/transferase [Bacteroidales bacterium]
MKRQFKTQNLYLFLLRKFLLAFLLLLLSQALFYIFNTRIFHVDGFGEWMSLLWGNVRLGLAATMLCLAPYLLLMLLPFDFRYAKGYRTTCEVLYVLGCLLLTLPNLIDGAYYQFTYRRMSNEILGYLTIGGDMGNLIPKFLVDYWYATLSAVVLVALLWWRSRRMKLEAPRHAGRHDAFHVVGSVLCVALCLVLFRGGLQRTCLSPADATRYGQLKNSALALPTTYNILRTLGRDDLQKVDYLPEAEAQAMYSPLYNPPTQMPTRYGEWTVGGGRSVVVDSTSSQVRYDNVVFIILESFSQEYMGCYNEGVMPTRTPFLDSLAKHSAVCYSGRSNGKKSIESIPAVLASVPTLMDRPFIMSDFSGDTMAALPLLLRRHGFRTAFFHGAYNGSMDFDKFCEKAGVQSYYGRDEYEATGGVPADYDGTWGIYDEPFLQYMVSQLDTFREPFFATVFTISSHHPYALPEQYKGRFADGEHPILPCVEYADHALRQFFASASRRPWFYHTLFVILGDHPAQGLHRQYNDYDGWYRIPMLVYSPHFQHQEATHEVMQQIDLMPTVLDYLGIDEPAVCFGQSVLRREADDKGWQVVFGNGYHQLVRNGRVAAMGRKCIGDTSDLRFLQAVVQQYNQRLIDNQLTR